jgi:fructan beta-fructosidase
MRLLFPLLAFAAVLPAADDIVIADFEAPSYLSWTTEGSAFGAGPAKGTLPGQMHVTDYAGSRLASSYHGKDGSMGKLTSPAFTIERDSITFLIGGGGYKAETCMNLIVDGQILRSATGTNTKPGGSEALEEATWEVRDLKGKQAILEIIDQRKGGWGHISVDQIVQTDRPALSAKAFELTRTMKLSAKYLHLPLMRRAGGNRKAGTERFSMHGSEGKLLRYAHMEFAPVGSKAEFTLAYDVSEFVGQEVTLRFKSKDAEVLNRIIQSDEDVIDPAAYSGPHRPQFHFSPRLGWMNDINGSHYANGLYHVFYQANPTTTGHSTGFDMHWGHSVSRDLLHWEEWPIALHPGPRGQCYSGTGLITQDGQQAMFYTATGGDVPTTQQLVTSKDGGRSWQHHAGNPVIPQIKKGNRDPKVLWHEASQHYVMVLYVGDPDTYRFLRSKDLVKWEEVSSLEHWFECPEFIQVKSPTSGEDLWLLYGCYRDGSFKSNSCYQLGRFDGKRFIPVTKLRNAHLGPNYYAALTFTHQPQGRHIMMGWTRVSQFPGEPFNQCASVPLELTLRSIGGEDVLCFQPVRELNALHGDEVSLTALTKDMPCDVTLSLASSATLRVRGLEWHYDASVHTVSHGKQSMKLHPAAKLSVRLLMDRAIVETFWNEGEAATCTASLHTDEGPALDIQGSEAQDLRIQVMRSIWPIPH